jgi:cephalosporin hydroxylase
MPTDIVVTQEVIWDARPEVIIETGVARGGSVILYASILQLLGAGTVIGVDVDVRPHNRETIDRHPLAHRIELVEGPSTSPATLERVRELVGDAERVMVVLDSDHTHEHVLAELRAYAPLVGVGQYLVVADTIVERIPVQEHRPRAWGPGNNPATAAAAFLAECDDFEVDHEVDGKLLVSSSPSGYLRRVR